MSSNGLDPASVMPFVSVVLPVRNEARHIGRCLESVLAQTYPAERLEILVADGMSNDGTRERLETFRTRCPDLQVVSNPGQIVPTGLNAVIARARGDIVARVDGHCEIAPDYISRCVWHLQHGADAVGGPLETIGETLVARAIAAAMSSVFGVGNSAFRTVHNRSTYTDTVAFPAYPRAVLDRLGPFDEELVRNQDDEYNYRLRKQGGRILLAADVHSRYFSRSSVRSLWRQYAQYGFWKVRVLQKHPAQMRLRQFVPPLFVAALLLAAVLAWLVPQGSWLLAAIVLPYLGTNLAVSAWIGRRNPRLIPVLPPIFATLHLAYGLGFLAGLIRFRTRWGDARSATASPPSAGFSRS